MVLLLPLGTASSLYSAKQNSESHVIISSTEPQPGNFAPSSPNSLPVVCTILLRAERDACPMPSGRRSPGLGTLRLTRPLRGPSRDAPRPKRPNGEGPPTPSHTEPSHPTAAGPRARTPRPEGSPQLPCTPLPRSALVCRQWGMRWGHEPGALPGPRGDTRVTRAESEATELGSGGNIQARAPHLHPAGPSAPAQPLPTRSDGMPARGPLPGCCGVATGQAGTCSPRAHSLVRERRVCTRQKGLHSWERHRAGGEASGEGQRSHLRVRGAGRGRGGELVRGGAAGTEIRPLTRPAGLTAIPPHGDWSHHQGAEHTACPHELPWGKQMPE